MKEKKEYKSPMIQVFKLDVYYSLLTGSGTLDPLYPEDI